MTVSYPLHWPEDMPRTRNPMASRFKTSVSGAVKNVTDELRRFGADSKLPVTDVIVSSNVTLVDQHPKDGGIAVYFRWDNRDNCIAIDRYSRPEENLQAVALIMDAERTKLRHGGLNIVRASFRGFTALPPPKDGKPALSKPWWIVLGFSNGMIELEAAENSYRKLVKEYHPDRAGGDAVLFNQVSDAIRQAREVLRP